MSNRDNLRWRLTCSQYEIRPPYVREENERVPLPGSGTCIDTYINDALREVWQAAFREVLDILDEIEGERERQ
mgnify:CR=1 FL=1